MEDIIEEHDLEEQETEEEEIEEEEIEEEIEEEDQETPGNEEPDKLEFDPDKTYTFTDPDSGEIRQATGKELPGLVMFKDRYDQRLQEFQEEKAQYEEKVSNLEKTSQMLEEIKETWTSDPLGFIHEYVEEARRAGYDISLVARDGDEYVPYRPQQRQIDPRTQKELETLREFKAQQEHEQELAALAQIEQEKYDSSLQAAKEEFGENLTEGIQNAMRSLWSLSDDPDWNYRDVLLSTFPSLKNATKLPTERKKTSKRPNPSKASRNQRALGPAEKARKKLGLSY